MNNSFNDFWALVASVWTDGLFGINIGQIITAIGIFVLFLFLRGLFSKFVIHQIARLVKNTKNDLDDQIIEALEKPLRFVPIVMGFYFATDFLDSDGSAAQHFENITRSLVAFAIFWGLYSSIAPLMQSMETSGRFINDAMLDWMRKALKTIVLFLGAATILEIYGIKVLPLIAGLGLFGVAIALGAQDLFKNLIAGLFVIGERRFKKGDWILVDGEVEGTVEQIGFRTTKIRRFDKAPVFIPNSALSDNAVTNFSQMTHRRITWRIGLEYKATAKQLRTVRDGIEKYIMDNTDFSTGPEMSTFVRIDRFSDSSIDLFLYCFTHTTNWGEWLEVKEELILAIKSIVEEASVGFAFPSHSIYLETSDSGEVLKKTK